MYPQAGQKWRTIPHATGMIGRQVVTVIDVQPLENWVWYVYDTPGDAGLSEPYHRYQRRIRSFLENARKVDVP